MGCAVANNPHYVHQIRRFIHFVHRHINDGNVVAGDCAGAECGAIRPERIRVVENSHAGAFSAEIIRGTYLGESAEWLCRAGDGELTVKEFASIDRKAGDKVFLAFDSGSLLAMK